MNIPPPFSSLPLVLLLAALPALAVPPTAGGGAREPGKPMQGGPHMNHGMHMSMHDPDTLKWGAPPPVLPRGAQLAVLDGDPHKPGPYVIRLKMPPGYRIPPHWHSNPENVTVISGKLMLGMGDTVDKKAAQELKTGGFHSIGAKVHHYAYSDSGAVVQIHGEGPFDITYINPADNPEPASQKQPQAQTPTPPQKQK